MPDLRRRPRSITPPAIAAASIRAHLSDILRAAAAGGADAIEVGIPFSDPVMDGPVIQEANDRALEAGITPPAVLDQLADLDAGVPLAVMTYANLVFRFGWRRFAARCAEVGVSGAILPDIPLALSKSMLAR